MGEGEIFSNSTVWLITRVVDGYEMWVDMGIVSCLYIFINVISLFKLWTMDCIQMRLCKWVMNVLIFKCVHRSLQVIPVMFWMIFVVILIVVFRIFLGLLEWREKPVFSHGRKIYILTFYYLRFVLFGVFNNFLIFFEDWKAIHYCLVFCGGWDEMLFW